MMDALHASMFEAGWSDGLPLVPPTKAAVEAMLKATSRSPTESLGDVPPMYSSATIGLVAANAVMAGCAPEHFRIVLAGVEAMLSEAFNLHGVHATTMGATPCLIVNGPARLEAGLNSAHGALGSGSRANACIGRALKLVIQNIGGAKLGGTESTTLGTPAKFTLCIAEAEEVIRATALGWAPFHAASRGFNAGDSAVTVLACTTGPMQLVDFATRDACSLVRTLGSHLAIAYAAHMPLVNEALLVVSPEHLHTLSRGGVTSKAELATCLFHTSNRASSHHLISTLHLAKPDLPRILLIAIGAVLTALAVSLSLVADCLALLLPSRALDFLPLHSLVVHKLLGAPKFTSPDSLHIVVAGAGAGKFSSFCAGFGVGRPPRPTANLSVACSRAVEPPPAAPPTAAPPAGRGTISELSTIALAGAAEPLIDPRGFRGPTSTLAAAVRPGSLEGAAGGKPAPLTLGLLDISKNGGATLLDELERKLCYDHPSLLCVRYRKPTFSRPMPQALAKQMADKCHVAVAALAD